MPLVQQEIVAFLSNEDSPDIRNPIHSTEVARRFGFRGPLVGGVTVWGWATPAILKALGEGWLDRGWADFAFRQPTYPGDILTIEVAPAADRGGDPSDIHSVTMTNQDGVACVLATVGLGEAPWLDEYVVPRELTPRPAPAPLPPIVMGETPTGVDWDPAVDETGPAEMEAYWQLHHRAPDARFQGDPPRLHPGWLAGRAERVLRHNYALPQSIHFRSRVQHLAPAFAGAAVITGAHLLEIAERRGHHAATFDCLLRREDDVDLALLRHWTIVKVATPEERGR